MMPLMAVSGLSYGRAKSGDLHEWNARADKRAEAGVEARAGHLSRRRRLVIRSRDDLIETPLAGAEGVN